MKSLKTRISLHILLSLFAGLLFWFSRTQNDYGDAAHWIALNPFYGLSIREPYSRWFLHFCYKLYAGFTEATGILGYLEVSRDSIALLSCVLGILTVFIFLQFLHKFFSYHYKSPLTTNSYLFFFILSISNYGWLQMFFGYIEVYPLLSFGLFLYLILGIGALVGMYAPWWAFFIYGFVWPLHLSMAFFGPTLLYLYLKANPKERFKSLLALLITSGLGLATIVGQFGFSPSVAWSTLWQETLGTEQGFLSCEEVLSFQHLMDMITTYLRLFGAALTAGYIGLMLGAWRKLPGKSLVVFLSIAVCPYLVWTYVWRQALSPEKDWDLFQALTIPVAFLGAYLFMSGLQQFKRWQWLAIVMVVISVAIHAPCVYRNSVAKEELFPPFWNISSGELQNYPTASSINDLKLRTSQQQYRSDDILRIIGRLKVGQQPIEVDIWSFVRLPDGRVLFYDSILLPNYRPWRQELRLEAGFNTEQVLYEYPVGTKKRPRPNDHFFDCASKGTYLWYLIIVDSSTQNVIAAEVADFALILL